MSDLSNDTKKHTTKSRETIPLSSVFLPGGGFHREGIGASVIRNNYVKKCAKFGLLTKPTVFAPSKINFSA